MVTLILCSGATANETAAVRPRLVALSVASLDETHREPGFRFIIVRGNSGNWVQLFSP
jgi:hypothetical protein